MSRTFTTLLLLALASVLTGCASHKPRPATSSWRMIDEGDPNPFITDSPARAGTITKQKDER